MTIIVGINPTKAQYRKGCAFFRLQEWIEFLGYRCISFTNLSDDPHWDGRVDYEFLNESLSGHDRVVALGGLVSKHLTKMNVNHFILPHPSPLNRQINDPDFIHEKLQECKEYLK